MSHKAGADGSRPLPVIDTNGGPLDLPAAVVAHNSTGETLAITASWEAVAAPHPDIEGATFRDIVIPLVTVPRGLWGFVLTVDGGEDVFLCNEVIV